MERDFLGLSVKQEASQETDYAAPVRSSQLQMKWPFSKRNSSSFSSSLSFHGAQEEQPKSGFNFPASSMALKNQYFDSSQKNVGSENQSEGCYSMATHPTKQQDTHPFHRSILNQVSLTMSPSATNSMQNSGRLASLPAMPSNSPVVGTTNLRNALNNSAAPAQLTIFYNGSVCVFDNIAPEKAQAIMLLAGNGPSMAFPATTPPPTPSQTHTQVQVPIPRPNALNSFIVSHSYSTTPPRISPPPAINSISVSQSYNNIPTPRRSCPAPVMNPIIVSQSHNISKQHLSSTTPVMNSVSVSQPFNDTNFAKPSGVLASKISQPQRVVNSQGPAPISPDAVPQFRRRSLARFMERRMERAMVANPYADCSKPRDGGKSKS